MPTYTYSGDPSTSPKDAVRFYLHDRGPSNWLFSDEEINYMIAQQGNVWGAAGELAIVQSTRYTDMRDKTVGPLSIKYGEIADRWLKLANSLKSRGASNSGAMAISTGKGGRPYFRTGMMDIHGDEHSLLGSDPRDLTDYGV